MGIKHEFKSMNGKWVLVVDEDNGFYLYDSEAEDDDCIIIDASTLFSRENAWIELLNYKNNYDFYVKCEPNKTNSFGLSLKNK